MIKDYLNQPFHLLDQKKNRWLLIIVIGLYVILFMNLYQPFNISRWYANESVPLFLILSSFGLSGMLVLMVSQLVIRELFKIRALRLYEFLLWFLVELILLSLTMFMIYGEMDLRGAALVNEIFLTLKYTMLVLIIPYTGVLLYLHSTQQGENIDTLMKPGNHLVKILNDTGELHMAIDVDQLLYIQSADNYAAVFFMKEDKVRKELVRTSLKRLETELDEYPIRRCHRSFMVNINKVSITEKKHQGLSLELRDYTDEIIPVSRNYTPFFIRVIKEREAQKASSVG